MIKVNYDEIISALRNAKVPEKQFPFFASRALNEVLLAGRVEVREKMPNTFVIRRKRTLQGVRVTLSHKNSLQGDVYHVDPYMSLHIHGGTQEKGTAKYQAIPVNIRNPKGKILSPVVWPKNLVARRKAFYIRTKNGNIVLFRRKGENLQADYVLKESIKIRATWPMLRQVENIATGKVGKKHFRNAVLHALSKWKVKK